MNKKEAKATRTKKINALIKKWEAKDFNEGNFEVGGGIADTGKFESNRHADAKNDNGKITFGVFTAQIKRATGISTSEIKSIIANEFRGKFEWHHAGKLPKQYGGGMGKTSFVNAKQAAEILKIFLRYDEIKKQEERGKKLNAAKEKARLRRKENFLKKTPHRFFEREILQDASFCHVTKREMNGKYGWFAANFSYNLSVYNSGIMFENNRDVFVFKHIDNFTVTSLRKQFAELNKGKKLKRNLNF